MKRILYASFFAACTALGLSSCMNGDYDADPTNVSSSSNPLNQGNNGGSGGSGGGTNSSFNWSGTDPMSAKINGTGWQAAGITYAPAIQGFTASVIGQTTEDAAVTVSIPNNPTLNTTYSFGPNLFASYSEDLFTPSASNIYTTVNGGSGQVMITENDENHIKGKFYFTGKNVSGETRVVSEGYFDADKN